MLAHLEIIKDNELYSYRYDIETGGILLGNDIAQMSNEPRPVYASELELLGMDKYW